MAKLTTDEAKLKLQPIADTIEKMKAAGIEINQLLTDEFNRLTKIIEGSTSSKKADWFNLNIAEQYNTAETAQDILTALEGEIGTNGRISYSIVTDAETKLKKLVFAGTSSTGAGQKAGTASGGTKAATAFNHYVISTKSPLTDYKEQSGEFGTASNAVKFILNNGKNPMNLGAEWQAGNSMVRALKSLEGVKEFTDNFTVVCSYVAPVAKTETPAVEPVAEATV